MLNITRPISPHDEMFNLFRSSVVASHSRFSSRSFCGSQVAIRPRLHLGLLPLQQPSSVFTFFLSIFINDPLYIIHFGVHVCRRSSNLSPSPHHPPVLSRLRDRRRLIDFTSRRLLPSNSPPAGLAPDPPICFCATYVFRRCLSTRTDVLFLVLLPRRAAKGNCTSPPGLGARLNQPRPGAALPSACCG